MDEKKEGRYGDEAEQDVSGCNLTKFLEPLKNQVISKNVAAMLRPWSMKMALWYMRGTTKVL